MHSPVEQAILNGAETPLVPGDKTMATLLGEEPAPPLRACRASFGQPD